MEEERERKDGGGEEGVRLECRGIDEWECGSSSSWAFTYLPGADQISKSDLVGELRCTNPATRGFGGVRNAVGMTYPLITLRAHDELSEGGRVGKGEEGPGERDSKEKAKKPN